MPKTISFVLSGLIRSEIGRSKRRCSQGSHLARLEKMTSPASNNKAPYGGAHQLKAEFTGLVEGGRGGE